MENYLDVSVYFVILIFRYIDFTSCVDCSEHNAATFVAAILQRLL